MSSGRSAKPIGRCVDWTVRLALVAAASPVLAIASPSHAGGPPTFIAVGDLPGGRVYSDALAVSACGDIVVGASSTGSTPLFDITESLRWIAADGPERLAPNAAGMNNAAQAVSQSGDVVVGSLALVPPDIQVVAYRWRTDEGISLLGDLPGGRIFSAARGVSADGSVIVGYSSSAESYASCDSCVEAWKWTVQTGLVRLGDLDGGIRESRAHAVSADGSVIVGFGSNPGGPVAVRWQGDSMIEMGFLPLGKGSPTQSQCFGVNRDGTVIVGASGSENGFYEAFRWTPQDGMIGLGDLPGGPFQSYAYAVSGDGSIVVGAGTAEGGLFGSGESHAFIWDAAHGMRDLKVVLAGLGLIVDGWTLGVARSISADGRTIVGSGINPAGLPEGWIAYLGSGCRADFNGDGFTDTNDFFLFIGAFFSGSVDFNGDGASDSQDFYDFMSAFFEPCF